MKVKMKLYEKMCVEYCKKFKGWELRCATKDSYLQGFKDAVAMMKVKVHPELRSMMSRGEAMRIADTLGTEEVEVEFNDGEHQLKQ